MKPESRLQLATGGDCTVVRTPWAARVLFTLAGGLFVSAVPAGIYREITDPIASARARAESVLPTWVEWPIIFVLAVIGAYGISIAWRSEVRISHDSVAKRWPLGRWRTIRRAELTSMRLETKVSAAIGPTWPAVHIHLTARTSHGERRLFIGSDTTSLGPLLNLCQAWAGERPEILADERTRRLLTAWATGSQASGTD